MEKFCQALEDCTLEDLGFVGDAYTWHNHHQADMSCEWRIMFPLVRVINVDPRHSDHRPVIVECGEREEAWRQLP